MFIKLSTFVTSLTVSLLSMQDNVASTDRPFKVVSGTTYAKLLDGTVLAQYNFSDDVIVVASPVGVVAQSSVPIANSSESYGEKTAFVQAMVYDMRGCMVWSRMHVTGAQLRESLNTLPLQPVVVVTIQQDGSVQRRLYW